MNRQDEASSTENDELLRVLRAIEIRVPANLTKGKEVTQDLLHIAYSNRDTLINGVTNAAHASDSETFFYFNILPKLQAHGLADNEKVPGAKYRRSFLNRRGQKFFAALETKRLLSKLSEQQAQLQESKASKPEKVGEKRPSKTKKKKAPEGS